MRAIGNEGVGSAPTAAPSRSLSWLSAGGLLSWSFTIGRFGLRVRLERKVDRYANNKDRVRMRGVSDYGSEAHTCPRIHESGVSHVNDMCEACRGGESAGTLNGSNSTSAMRVYVAFTT